MKSTYSHRSIERNNAMELVRVTEAEMTLEGYQHLEIIVSSQPGMDISATFQNKRLLVAECKGEPTPTAVKSGLDRTAFYAAVGQIIITSGSIQPQPQHKVVVLADTDRLRVLARHAVQNNLLKQIGLSFALVDSSGNVSEIQTS